MVIVPVAFPPNHLAAAPSAGRARSGLRFTALGIPDLFRILLVVGDNARPVARRTAPFVLSAFINNAFSVAFRASLLRHLSLLRRSTRRAFKGASGPEAQTGLKAPGPDGPRTGGLVDSVQGHRPGI